MIRLLTIIHLCLAMILLVWFASFPFLGQRFNYMQKLFLIHNVTGNPELLSYVSDEHMLEAEKRLEKTREMFKNLPSKEKSLVYQDLQWMEKQLASPWQAKLTDLKNLFFKAISPLLLAWMVFSIAICFLILYRIRGAEWAVWLLPLLALIYSVYSLQFAPEKPLSPEEALFPSNEVLSSYHIDSKPLERAWESYLISEWSTDKTLESGEFHFNYERLKILRKHPDYLTSPRFNHREPLPLLIAFLGWNFLFAAVISIKK